MASSLILTITCDRCGKKHKIASGVSSTFTEVIVRRISIQQHEFGLPTSHVMATDLCPSCTRDLAEWLGGKIDEDYLAALARD